jgi:hypothetical protein
MQPPKKAHIQENDALPALQRSSASQVSKPPVQLCFHASTVNGPGSYLEACTKTAGIQIGECSGRFF